MKKEMLKKMLAITMFIGMAGLSFTTHADAVVNTILQSGENQFQDTDAERIIRGGNTVTSGAFQVGDVIETILRFTDANGTVLTDQGAQFGFPYQLIAYAELEIAEVNDLGGGFVNLVFTPSGNLGTDVFVELYERTTNTPGFDVTIDPATAIANVRSQTLIAELGLGDDDDDFWSVASTVNDIGAIALALPGSQQAANGTFGLTVLTNAGNIPVATNGILSGTDGNLHDVVGSASAYVRDTGANTGWLVSSNTEVRFNTVPEPSSLALLSLGLFAAGGMAKRRRV
ncbi:MAG: PEP-CTERM sorting domain-containing protein [Methylobacter sp.]